MLSKGARAPRIWARRFASRVAVLLGVGVAALVMLSSAGAVHNTTVFELDGNSANDPLVTGVDFDNVFAGTDGALDSAFEHDETEPDASHHRPSNKDEAAINGGTSGDWGCVVKPNVNNKDDIRHSYAAAYLIGGDLYIFFGADRDRHSGDANIGFWFFQTDVGCTAPGDFTGHKVDGDLFVVSAFVGGGSIPEIDVYAWEDPTPLFPESGDEFLGDGVTAGEPLVSGVDCQTTPDPPGHHAVNADVCATINGATISVPWESPGTVQQAEFFEGGVNLSNLIPTGGCFTEFLAETRSSQSLDANLFDYVFGDLNTCGFIRAHKYHDLNANGVDNAEPDLADWTIFIDEDADEVLDANETSLVTDANGEVLFSNLSSGTYSVCEVLESGWFNSDPAGATLCESVVVTTGEEEFVDFGNFQNATISGMKFKDADADGVKDGGEIGLGGWQIHLFNAGLTVHQHTTTDVNGLYSFSAVPPGTYTLCETVSGQTGWVQSFPASGTSCTGHTHGGTITPGAFGHSVTVTSGQTAGDKDFGNTPRSQVRITFEPLADLPGGADATRATLISCVGAGSVANSNTFLSNAVLTNQSPLTCTITFTDP